MVVTNYARERLALRLGSQVDNIGSCYIAIGSGSGLIGVTTTGLLHYFDRNGIGTPASYATAQEMLMTVDFASTELSGLNMQQFGLFVESSGGKTWQVEGIKPLLFTGLEELQIQITYRVY